ncbi:hypothetical protein Adt_02445 [Abeliophyllum distichum]|uniref:Uncharacterized protein n=1 Tax=Abeliophyllum distichum TaxID=126358 RepID=A0ABD1VVP3_9LAMI
MPWVKIAAKLSRRGRLPSSSSEEEAPQATRIDYCPVLIGKNVDLVSFTFDAPSFHVKDLFVATDTINTITLRRMKIVKEDGQWVAKSKGFNNESGPFTLPFEGGKEMDEEEDEPPPRPRSRRPSPSISGFTEDYFNLLNGRIESLTSSVEGLHHTVEVLCHTMGTLQQSIDNMTTLLQALDSHLDAVLPPHLLPKN